MAKKKETNEPKQQTTPAEETVDTAQQAPATEGAAAPEEELKQEEQAAKESVEEIKKLADENYDKYLRLAAEFDNYKKRTQKEKEELSLFVVADTVEKILPVLDNLERALASCEKDKDTPMYDGVKMVIKQFGDIFSAMGITPIEAAGKPFDPNLHNAVMHVEDENAGESVVVEELMRGYLYRGKVIRHSMVKVAN